MGDLFKVTHFSFYQGMNEKIFTFWSFPYDKYSFAAIAHLSPSTAAETMPPA